MMKRILVILIGMICSLNLLAEEEYYVKVTSNSRWYGPMYYIEASGLYCYHYVWYNVNVIATDDGIWWNYHASDDGATFVSYEELIKTGYVEYYKYNNEDATSWNEIWQRLTRNNQCWIYINPITKQMGVEFNIYTSVDDISQKTIKPRKYIENGMIVFQIGDTKYNIMGQVIQ